MYGTIGTAKLVLNREVFCIVSLKFGESFNRGKSRRGGFMGEDLDQSLDKVLEQESLKWIFGRLRHR